MLQVQFPSLPPLAQLDDRYTIHRASARKAYHSFHPKASIRKQHTVVLLPACATMTGVLAKSPPASAVAPPSPQTASAAMSSSAPSSSSSFTTTTMPQRPRHHVRSVTQQSMAFASSSPSSTASTASFTLTPPRRHSASKMNFHPFPVASSPAGTPPAPSKAKSTAASAAEIAAANLPTPPPSSVDVSPSKSVEESTSALLDGDDAARLRRLMDAQSKRRPRLMRLTPAYASLPGRLSSEPQTAPLDGSMQRMEESAQNSGSRSPPSQDPRRNMTAALEPPRALQLDMSNLPSPSAGDSTAPQSTSELNEIRTKSGRLIKPSLKSSSHFVVGGRSDQEPATARPARAKSTPNTPSVPKAVQFDTKLEHIKVFKFKQRPTAISRQGSPEQTETETEEEREVFPFVNYARRSPTSGNSTTSSPAASSAVAGVAETDEQLILRLPNFPSSARLSVDKEIFLERIYLADDLRSVKGTVRVRNIAFEKWVAVRFTLDDWVTVNEVSADYAESVKDGESDRFTFSIKLNELLNWPRGAGGHETKTMFLCLRYRTGGNAEFWDNNDGLNYQLDFRKRQLPPTPLPTPNVGGARATRSSSVNSHTLQTSPQARAIALARRSGVHNNKSGAGFVEDLRRELDRLKSDEEVETAPVLTKRPSAAVADVARRSSPPVSPGQRSGSPLWSARYDWGESLRNSSTAQARSRNAVLDYFTAKPPSGTPHSLSGSSAQPNVKVSGSSPASGESSALPTPTLNSFGPVRSGMFSPAVGDVMAHHQPITSRQTSATSSPDKLNVPLLGHDGRMSPLVPGTPSPGASPTRRPGSSKFFSYPPQRRGGNSPISSQLASPMDSDEDDDNSNGAENNGSPVTRSPAPPKIITVPRSSVRKGSIDKQDGLILANYDNEPSSPPSSTLSPSMSISSADSDATGVSTPGLVTPEESNLAAAMEQLDPSLTPRLTPRRHWSPSNSNRSSTDRPRSAADLSELIQKYCWSSDITPGTAPIPEGLAIGGGSDLIGSTAAAAAGTGGLYALDGRTTPLSGTATPTMER
ncbi:hypothetical protein BDZ90DRAFT_135472 [Jaminaea rosea]|uniref:CBM21 domain-containing protein n=1 Tax=Jaminaea rosea TaxID=1569628 RepID=A0A316UVC6_9BASI|nr:hypothetical protein BDZ90DRAFT_135472 [Jaminaea rosea]PWN28964.1 hypothetical protein BDZ90DRAFT_135472 [Jaminaea rosea]